MSTLNSAESESEHTSAGPEHKYRLVWALRRAEIAVQGWKERLLRPIGIGSAHYGVLVSVAADPGLTSAALARRLGVTAQAVAAMLPRLERANLVERRQHPRHDHVFELHLTDFGRTTLDEADEAIRQIESLVVGSLGVEAVRLLREQLERITDLAAAQS